MRSKRRANRVHLPMFSERADRKQSWQPTIATILICLLKNRLHDRLRLPQRRISFRHYLLRDHDVHLVNPKYNQVHLERDLHRTISRA